MQSGRILFSMLLLTILILLAGCQQQTGTNTGMADQPSADVQPPTPGGNGESMDTSILTIMQAFQQGKMLHCTYSVTEGQTSEGSVYGEFYAYQDEQRVTTTLPGERVSFDAIITGNDVYLHMVGSPAAEFPFQTECDWVRLPQDQADEVEESNRGPDFSGNETIQDLIVRQGNVYQQLHCEFKQYDPARFQPTGRVCDFQDLIPTGFPG